MHSAVGARPASNSTVFGVTNTEGRQSVDSTTKIPLGVKLIIGFFVLSTVLWTIGQGGTVIFYDAVAELGFQEPRESLDPVIVEVNRGIGLADMIVQIPLFVLAIVGLWQLRFYGAVASWLALGISLYWPVVAWTTQYFYAQAAVKSLPFDMATHGILAFVFLFSVWASWYLYKNSVLFD